MCAIGWQLQYVFRLPVLSTEAPLREAPVDGYHLKRSCTSKIDCIDGKSEEAGVNAGTVFKQHSFAFLQAVFPDQSAQSRKEAGAGQHPLGEHTPITLANDFHFSLRPGLAALFRLRRTRTTRMMTAPIPATICTIGPDITNISFPHCEVMVYRDKKPRESPSASVNTAGPIMMMKTVGKINSTRGIKIRTAAFLAFSLARFWRWIRRSSA